MRLQPPEPRTHTKYVSRSTSIIKSCVVGLMDAYKDFNGWLLEEGEKPIHFKEFIAADRMSRKRLEPLKTEEQDAKHYLMSCLKPLKKPAPFKAFSSTKTVNSESGKSEVATAGGNSLCRDLGKEGPRTETGNAISQGVPHKLKVRSCVSLFGLIFCP